jgi:hypothetical protein
LTTLTKVYSSTFGLSLVNALIPPVADDVVQYDDDARYVTENFASTVSHFACRPPCLRASKTSHCVLCFSPGPLLRYMLSEVLDSSLERQS